MKNLKFTIKEILSVCEGRLITRGEEALIENFSKDTRQIKNNDMYIAIKGENFDGNNYFKEALDKGAIGCLVDNEEIEKEDLSKYDNKNVIYVKDTILAIQKLAKYKRDKYNIPVIAITGSVGKTSTKDIIASVMSQKYNVLKTEGNLNNHIGLPLTLLKLKDHKAVVVEMGMNHFGEIRVLTKIAEPSVCVITNIGTSHIGNLGSRENILKSKLEILEGMNKEDGFLVINNDNDLLHNFKEENKNSYNILTYGLNENSKIYAKNICMNENGSTFTAVVEGEEHKFYVPVEGEHFIYNSLCAICIGKIFNIGLEQISKGIEKFTLSKKRMEIEKIKDNVTIINDSYNASYDSVKVAIEYLQKVMGKRKIAVIGNMLELGDFTKELHEKVAEDIIKNKIDILITVGEYAEYIANKAIELGMEKKNIFIFENNLKASEKLKEIIKKDDVILFKASNSMKFTEIVEEIKK